MAKIGTAHIEVKPVLNDGALDDLCAQIEKRIGDAVRRGMNPPMANPYPDTQIYNGLCTCPQQSGPHPFHPSTHTITVKS